MKRCAVCVVTNGTRYKSDRYTVGDDTENLKIVNASCNWDSPQYELKTCKQSNVGVVQIFISKFQNYVRLCFSVVTKKMFDNSS